MSSDCIALGDEPVLGLVHRELALVLKNLVVTTDRAVTFVSLDKAPVADATVVHLLAKCE